MNERLITIPGYEGLYYIYDNGDCYSIRKGRYLKPHINNCDYVQYFLSPISGGKDGKWFKAHRLVLITFKGYDKDPKRKEVNHIDHNKHNNNLSNLEWVTHSENILKSYKEGRTSYWQGKTRTPSDLETRIKMSNAKLKGVKTIHRTTGQILEFGSVQSTIETLGMYRKQFNRCINGTTKHKAFDFEFINTVS